MAKSDKITVSSRVHDVFRLIVAGAEFADVRQYASDHGWNVSDRQVRRYIEMAHKRFAKATQRDRKQLLGRHLMQRRALYARSVKNGDLKTALQVLRDEAQLEGLYPSTKIDLTTSPGPQLSTESVRTRLVGRIAAEANHDRREQSLIEMTSPRRGYRFTDTQMPYLMLNIMALSYINEQLEAAAMLCNAMFCDSIRDLPIEATGAGASDGNNNPAPGEAVHEPPRHELAAGEEEPIDWNLVAMANAYRFKIGWEAWRQFTERLGIDENFFVRGNHRGQMLEMYGDKFCDLAPTAEELQAAFARRGLPEKPLVTAEDLARGWRRMLAKILDE